MERTGVIKLIDTDLDTRHTVTYHINQDKRKVVCVIHGCAFDAINEIVTYGHGVFDTPASLVIDDEYIGIAECHALDEFSEEKGMQIARHRAQSARISARNVAISKFLKKADTASAALKKYKLTRPEKKA